MKQRYFFPICVLLLAEPVEAAFKCVDGDGNITFSQQGCPTSEMSSEINVEAGLSSQPGSGGDVARACDLAGLYAEDAARRMREGSDYTGEMARYGGSYNAKASMVALANYVHSFAKGDAPPARIASLARAKCQSGGLGPVAFDDLPVSEYYVYDANQNGWVRKGTPVTAPAAGPVRTDEQTTTGETPPASSNGQDRKQRCDEAMAGLEGALKQMGGSEAEQAQIQKQLKAGCQ